MRVLMLLPSISYQLGHDRHGPGSKGRAWSGIGREVERVMTASNDTVQRGWPRCAPSPSPASVQGLPS